ncbi:MAG TPA: hypothetical protein VKC11_05025 [Steroidobacteraceae bacterium]|nr:hypothetical protein [Steroidobacteraceae bacterium]
MSAPHNASGAHRELAAPAVTPPAPPVPQVQAPELARTAAGVPAAATGTAALQRLQNTASRSLAEVAYRIRRLGLAATAGIAAVVLAATLFVANNLPQSAAVAALKGQLLRLTAAGPAAPAAAPGAVSLASLPPRGDAPGVVAKILEEANASSVPLPRGQYEYVPARDGVAARYRMTFPLHASYPAIREFMDRTLLALPAVAVDGLRIERKNVGDDTVDAELKLSAYVRSEE